MNTIQEATSKLTKEIKIVDGKKELVKERVYDEPCKEGYKRDSETGQCVRMPLTERRDRSIAATKAANKSSTKRNKEISMKRRDALIPESMTAKESLRLIQESTGITPTPVTIKPVAIADLHKKPTTIKVALAKINEANAIASRNSVEATKILIQNNIGHEGVAARGIDGYEIPHSVVLSVSIDGLSIATISGNVISVQTWSLADNSTIMTKLSTQEIKMLSLLI